MTGYVKKNCAKEQLKRNHGHRNHLKRNKLTIVANNKSSSFDRNYEGQTLFCYMISYFIVFIHCQVSEFGLAARNMKLKLPTTTNYL